MNLESMWTALEAYQPYARARGFGVAWYRMTTERTADAAWAAAEVAEEAELLDSSEAVWYAAEAAWNAASAVERDMNVPGVMDGPPSLRRDHGSNSWIKFVVEYITRAIELELPLDNPTNL